MERKQKSKGATVGLLKLMIMKGTKQIEIKIALTVNMYLPVLSKATQ